MNWYPLGVTPDIEVPTLPKWEKSRLLEAAGIDKESSEATGFLSDIAFAIGAAAARDHRKGETVPAEVRRKLQEAHALAEELAKKLDPLRLNGVACRMIDGGTIQVNAWLSQLQVIESELSAAKRKAKDELPARGGLKDYTRRHLAADIAEALHGAGIPLTISRPKQNRQGGIVEPKYISVLRVAIEIWEGPGLADPYPTARAGLKIFRQGCKDYPPE